MNTEFRYGRKIQQLREAKAWTQEQLAAAADVDVRTIQRVEEDSTKNPETLLAIAGAFNTDIESLRTKWLIPETGLMGTWLVTYCREFLNCERTHPAHQLVVS
jgi:transcriptional regulator with XRE-family HTH domain